MYETTSTFLQSELDYRTDRLKAGLRHPRRRRGRGLVSRRSAQPAATTR